MKCDGPSQVPCRGCRQSGQPCIFEARFRPKSVSAIPSRPPPFFQARSGTPTAAPGFYPSGPQPAPPVTSRTEPYALRHAREPMPPPPTTSIGSLTSTFPIQPQRTHSPPYHHPPFPPPLLLQLPPTRPPTSSSTESRLTALESGLSSISTIPAAIAALQASVNSLHSTQIRRGRGRVATVDVQEAVWENYRSRAWPLSPWLVGLREAQGLPGMVVDWLGRRTTREVEGVGGVMTEVGRLIAERVEWGREEVRALGVLAWAESRFLRIQHQADEGCGTGLGITTQRSLVWPSVMLVYQDWTGSSLLDGHTMTGANGSTSTSWTDCKPSSLSWL